MNYPERGLLFSMFAPNVIVTQDLLKKRPSIKDWHSKVFKQTSSTFIDVDGAPPM